MTEKRQRGRRSGSDDPSESRALRRLGATLTLLSVCVAVVFLGYFVGKYVIQGVVDDTLGPNQSVPAPQATTVQPSGSAQTASSASSPGSSGTPADTLGGSVVGGGQPSPTPAVPDTPPVPPLAPTVQPPVTSEPTVAAVPPAVPSPALSPSNDVPEAVVASAPAPLPNPPPGSRVLYRVQVGGFADRPSAEQLLVRLAGPYPDAYIVIGTEFRVQVASFSTRAGAEETEKVLRAQGFAPVHIVEARF